MLLRTYIVLVPLFLSIAWLWQCWGSDSWFSVGTSVSWIRYGLKVWALKKWWLTFNGRTCVRDRIRQNLKQKAVFQRIRLLSKYVKHAIIQLEKKAVIIFSYICLQHTHTYIFTWVLRPKQMLYLFLFIRI